MTFIAHFDLDMVAALSEQLVTALDKLTVAPLDLANIGQVNSHQGVYALYHTGSLVYIGKAHDLQDRLIDHQKKIGGRQNISLADMDFKCLYVHKNWTPLAPEDALIKHYKRHHPSVACTWNGNGFGPHDPGRKREETDKPPDGFDSLYPIKDTLPCTWIKPGTWLGLDLLKSLKEKLPYLLRYQATKDYRTGHRDYNKAKIVVPYANMPADQLLGLIASKLPNKWQATAFPSHMILYRERRRYAFGRIL